MDNDRQKFWDNLTIPPDARDDCRYCVREKMFSDAYDCIFYRTYCASCMNGIEDHWEWNGKFKVDE